MPIRKCRVIAAIITCVFVICVPRTIRADEGIFSKFTKAVDVVFTAVQKWNDLVNDITDKQVREQLQRRMYRLQKDMLTLERKKQDLLESMLAEKPIFENITMDVQDLQNSVRTLRQSLDDVSSALNAQQPKIGSQFEKEVNDDLNEKMTYLIEMELTARGTSEQKKQNKEQLKQRLEGALGKLRKARETIGQCLKKLQESQ